MSDDQVLYKEEHFLFEDHGNQTRLVLYRCRSNEPFARNQNVRIEFPLSGVLGPPSAQEIKQAAALTLVGHCPP